MIPDLVYVFLERLVRFSPSRVHLSVLMGVCLFNLSSTGVGLSGFLFFTPVLTR